MNMKALRVAGMKLTVRLVEWRVPRIERRMQCAAQELEDLWLTRERLLRLRRRARRALDGDARP